MCGAKLGLVLHGQAEKEAGPPTAEESVGTWFSNPAAGHGAAEQRSGVGKYLEVKAPKKVAGSAASSETPDLAANGGPGPPPAKKTKAAAGYGNFSGW